MNKRKDSDTTDSIHSPPAFHPLHNLAAQKMFSHIFFYWMQHSFVLLKWLCCPKVKIFPQNSANVGEGVPQWLMSLSTAGARQKKNPFIFIILTYLVLRYLLKEEKYWWNAILLHLFNGEIAERNMQISSVSLQIISLASYWFPCSHFSFISNALLTPKCQSCPWRIVGDFVLHSPSWILQLQIRKRILRGCLCVAITIIVLMQHLSSMSQFIIYSSMDEQLQ